jgi:hypothetical protein
MTKSTGDEVLDARDVKPSSAPARRSRRAVPHPSRAARAKSGTDARLAAPLDSQAELVTHDRPDPVELLESQAASRVADLVPIRYGG